MSSSDPSSQNEIQVQTFKALPRDPSQPEHKKPRAFIHRPNESPSEEGAPRVLDAAKSIQLDDFTKVHRTPCVRDAMLPAIGGGVAIGAGRFVLGGSIMAACNWASACFVGVSVVMYNFCQRRRSLEKEGIRRAVEVLDKKQALKDMQDKARAMGEERERTKGAAGAMAGTSVKASTTGAGAGATGATAGQAGQQAPGGREAPPFWSTFKFW